MCLQYANKSWQQNGCVHSIYEFHTQIIIYLRLCSRFHISGYSPKNTKCNFLTIMIIHHNYNIININDMACKRCEISKFIKDNGVDLFFATAMWLSALGDEAKTVELAPSGIDVKSFPRQSRSRGGGIATVCK